MAQRFKTATDGSTVQFDLARSERWQVTLGGNRTLSIVNAEAGDVLYAKIIQDGTGSRTLTWPSTVQWGSGSAPTLKTAASSTDVFQFVYDGTNWKEVSGGAPSRMVNRIEQAGLATVVAVAATALTLNLSSGGGAASDIGALSDAVIQKAGTGSDATWVYRRTGSGEVLTSGSGADVGVGIDNLDASSRPEDARFHVNATNGNVTALGTISGATLHTLTGVILGDSDGAGCSTVYVLDGVVSAATTTCP